VTSAEVLDQKLVASGLIVTAAVVGTVVSRVYSRRRNAHYTAAAILAAPPLLA